MRASASLRYIRNASCSCTCFFFTFVAYRFFHRIHLYILECVAKQTINFGKHLFILYLRKRASFTRRALSRWRKTNRRRTTVDRLVDGTIFVFFTLARAGAVSRVLRSAPPPPPPLTVGRNFFIGGRLGGPIRSFERSARLLRAGDDWRPLVRRCDELSREPRPWSA